MLIREPSRNVFAGERRDEGQGALQKDSRINGGVDGQKFEPF